MGRVVERVEGNRMGEGMRHNAKDVGRQVEFEWWESSGIFQARDSEVARVHRLKGSAKQLSQSHGCLSI